MHLIRFLEFPLLWGFVHIHKLTRNGCCLQRSVCNFFFFFPMNNLTNLTLTCVCTNLVFLHAYLSMPQISVRVSHVHRLLVYLLTCNHLLGMLALLLNVLSLFALFFYFLPSALALFRTFYVKWYTYGHIYFRRLI